MFHPRFETLICYVRRDDYLRIHAYCQDHDVEKGTTEEYIYDAPNGGGITVWNRSTFFGPKPSKSESVKLAMEAIDDQDRREPRSSYSCAYTWERTDDANEGESLQNAQSAELHDDADEVSKIGDVTVFSFKEGILARATSGCEILRIFVEPGYHLNVACDWSIEKDWTAKRALDHFLALHRKVLGRDLKPDLINRFE